MSSNPLVVYYLFFFVLFLILYIEIIFAIKVNISNANDVYDLIVKSYIAHITIVNIINDLNKYIFLVVMNIL